MTAAKKEGGPSETRSRWRVSTQEVTMLESVFIQSPQPTKTTLQSVASLLHVKPRQVQVWFQNRRQRWRKESGLASAHAHAASGKVADFCIDLPMSLPVGWERLLLSPAAKLAPVHPLDSMTPHTAQGVVEPEVSSACADEDGEEKSVEMIDSFFCARLSSCEAPPLMGRSLSDSPSLSLNCDEPRDEDDDTMWVGMEWFVGSESDSIH